jgi:amino acid transporter
MTTSLHTAAPEHRPAFIASPGETDVLMTVTAVVLVLAVMGMGLLFLRLHTLPERMAHKSKKIQFEIVAILGLLALFTHVHLFWVIGLLLAIIDVPDFGGTLGRMCDNGVATALLWPNPPPQHRIQHPEHTGCYRPATPSNASEVESRALSMPKVVWN